MARATVDKKVLDTLIRAKVATLDRCKDVRPLPVQWQAPDETGLNWAVSGWSGATDAVRACDEQMRPYLELLRNHFLIPGEARA
jgi:hypothetical protein